MIWYVRRGEREIGPLGEDSLRALVGTGQVTSDTLLWRAGLPDWTAAAALPGVLGPRAAAPALHPPENVADSTAAAAPRAGTTPFELARPWRRYWARYVDIGISMLLVSVLLGAIWPGLFSSYDAPAGQKWQWTPLLFVLPLAMAMDTLIYWALGNTPGKAIAGIRLLEEGGRRPLRALAHLGRNFGVYGFGLGLGFGPATLITLIYGYLRATAAKVSIWDRYSHSRAYVFSNAPMRTWATAAIYILAVAALMTLGLHGRHERERYAIARTPTPVLQQELTQAANRVNAGVPRMIDKITRLDGAHAGPGTLFTYEYSLINVRASLLSPTTLETFRWRLSADVLRGVCGGAALQPLLRAGAVIRFDYRDLDGQELLLASVSSADCARATAASTAR
jgi:hypothetical protein